MRHAVSSLLSEQSHQRSAQWPGNNERVMEIANHRRHFMLEIQVKGFEHLCFIHVATPYGKAVKSRQQTAGKAFVENDSRKPEPLLRKPCRQLALRSSKLYQ